MSLLVLLPDYTITTVNQSTCVLPGYEELELLGMNAERLFSPDFFVSAHASPSGYHRETTWRAKSGTMIPVLMSVRAIFSDNGVCNGYVCIAADLTERRRLELQLRLAQKLESIGQLAAGIAHEQKRSAEAA